MMALIHRVRARLPHGRALLYGEIAQAYLQSIDEFRGLTDSDYSLAQKRRWLARVAFEMQRADAGGDGPHGDDAPAGRPMLATAAQVRGWVRSAMAASGRGDDPATADEFLSYIGRRSGLLLPRGPGVFAFQHLSLQEYFAALFLTEQVTSPQWIRAGTGADGAGRDDLRRYARDERWQETLLFLFELLAERPGWPATLAEELFGADLADIAGDGPEQEGAALLLARVASDPHAGLDDALRRRAFERCMRYQIRAQKGQLKDSDGLLPFLAAWSLGSKIAQELFKNPEHQPLIWDLLIDAARDERLEGLSLDGCKAITDASRLAELTQLRQLNISGIRLNDIAFLAKLKNLEFLSVTATAVEDASALASLTHLKALAIDDPPPQFPLERLTSLSFLYLEAASLPQRHIDRLSELEALEDLFIRTDSSYHLSALTKLPRLKFLQLWGDGKPDISVLVSLQSLQMLVLSASKGITEDQRLAFSKERPDVRIVE